jgi:hypothetical protein
MPDILQIARFSDNSSAISFYCFSFGPPSDNCEHPKKGKQNSIKIVLPVLSKMDIQIKRAQAIGPVLVHFDDCLVSLQPPGLICIIRDRFFKTTFWQKNLSNKF